jgi:transcription elongation GreA/GreB family factor
VRKEIEALREGQAAIQKELQEIKNLLRARSAAAPAEPQNVVLNVEGAPFKGEKRAKVTLVDFSDYQ